MQAGGHRFDPVHLHQLTFSHQRSKPSATTIVAGDGALIAESFSAVVLFKKTEEVKVSVLGGARVVMDYDELAHR